MKHDPFHFATYSANLDTQNAPGYCKLYYSYHEMFTTWFPYALIPPVLTHIILPQAMIHHINE